jgi:molybdate transport system ATP-binding protein
MTEAANVRPALHVRLRQSTPIPLDVEFAVPDGSITALFGPSGSGKSTVLRSIAGLYTPQEAEITSGSERWTDSSAGFSLPTHRRRVGFVFQDYALFPHLTVRQQVGLALGNRPASARQARVDELLALARLDGLADRKPGTLSGGQQQRVALARALARDPAVLLLDEPFASVDWALRDALRHELRSLQRALSLSVVIVTHDFEDAAKLASQLVVLDGGTVVAAGSIEDLTASAAMTRLAGPWEPAVALDAVVASHDPQRQLTHLQARELRVAVPRIAAAVSTIVRIRIAAREVILASRRPEGLSLHNMIEARVLRVEPAAHPALRLVHLTVAGTPLLSLVTVDAVRTLDLAAGAPVLALVKAVSVEAFA